MTTSMLAFVLSHLDATKGRWPTVAERAGIPYRTLQKIGQRLIQNPGVDHVQKLHDFFRNNSV